MGISLATTGDIATGRSHFDRALALYDPAEHRALATRFSVDAAMSILSYRSWTIWVLGYPEAALADADNAIKIARDIEVKLAHSCMRWSSQRIRSSTAATMQQRQRKRMSLLSSQTKSAARFGLRLER